MIYSPRQIAVGGGRMRGAGGWGWGGGDGGKRERTNKKATEEWGGGSCR